MIEERLILVALGREQMFVRRGRFQTAGVPYTREQKRPLVGKRACTGGKRKLYMYVYMCLSRLFTRFPVFLVPAVLFLR